jgi:hypothetical protein
LNSNLYEIKLKLKSQFQIFFHCFFFFAFFAFQQISGWKVLSISGWKADVNFLDLGLVVNSSQCYQTIGSAVYKIDSAGNCAYIYGSSLLRILNIFNIETKNTYILGWLFIALISVLLGVVTSVGFSPKSKIVRIFSALVFLSPPVMLLLERGNFDVLMIFILFLSSLAHAKNYTATSIALICLASLFKFYTLPIAFVLLLFLKNKFSVVFGLVTTLTTTFIVLLDLNKIEHSFPSSLSGAFGNQLLGSYFEIAGFDLTRIVRDAIGVILLILVLIILPRIRYLKRIFPIALNHQSPQARLYFIIEVFFFAAFFCCYFAGISYDYRLIFLQIATFLEIARLYNLGYLTLGLQLLLLIISWFSFNLIYLQPISDVAILLTTGYFCRLFFLITIEMAWFKKIIGSFHPN